MKSYAEFLQLDEGKQAKLRSARKAERVQQAKANEPGAIVPVKTGPNTGGNQKENLGKRPTPQSRPQGVSGFKRPATARTGRGGAMERWRERQKKANQKPNDNPTSLKTLSRRVQNPGNTAKAMGRKARMNFKKDPIGTTKKVGGKVVDGAKKFTRFISKGNVASGAGATGAEIAQGETITKGNA